MPERSLLDGHPLLRDPERDACGIGFVADSRGRSSRAIVEAALDALCRVKHRGALAADALTGDGAGVLLPVAPEVVAPDVEPGERIGVALCFVREDVEGSKAIVEAACAAEGIELVRWREVPTDPSALGEQARSAEPNILQALLLRPVGVDGAEAERRAFRARRRIERDARSRSLPLYPASLSFRTVTYKALCAADQLAS